MIFAIVLAFGINSAQAATAVSASGDFVVSKSGASEQYERDVDQVALASQEQAISKLLGLLKKYRNTSQEPVLLAKLAELQQQNAAIRFRIAHGNAHRSKKNPDLSSYHRMLKQSIASLTDLIARYPHYTDLVTVYFMRGKGYEEIGDKEHATKDYLHLVGHYPDSDEAVSGYMSLAEFSIEANDHAKAIQYLRQVEKRPEDPHYPFALYKLAWSHYNLKNIPAALGYSERQVDYYNRRRDEAKKAGVTLTTSEDALRDNMLLDSTVFYLEGFEQGLSQYGINETLSYFKRLDQGPALGKMFLRYAKLLRSHDHEKEVVTWKDIVLSNEGDRPECLDVLLTVAENQLNKHNYGELVNSAQDFIRLYRKHPEFESFPKAQKLLLDTADGLHAVIMKNRGAEGVVQISTQLASIYDAFTKIVDESDIRIPRVHYNLAETLFEIQQYDASTLHYRWVVEKARGRQFQHGLSRETAALKAIAARYESLKRKQMIPGELKAHALIEGKEPKLDPVLAEWVEWVDEHLRSTRWKEGDAIENFGFEATRALYAAGQTSDALKRFRKFALKYPKSKFAIPSASLVLDTYITGQNWEQTLESAEDFLDVEDWQGSDFAKRVFATAADAFYKIIETTYTRKDHKTALKKSEQFLKRYGSSQRLADCLNIAGESALALQDKERAHSYFSRLISEAPQAAAAAGAWLARAGISEEREDFGAGARDYSAFLKARSGSVTQTPEKQINVLRKKTLMLAWLSADGGLLREVLAAPAVCDKNNVDLCTDYRALSALDPTAPPLDEVFDTAKKANTDTSKAIWAAVALEHLKDLSHSERLQMLRQLARNYDRLDPLMRFALLPRIALSVPRAISEAREQVRKIALKADARAIKRRVEWIREVETAITDVMKLPWARIRAAALSDVAGLYLDLARGLQSLPPPKGLPTEEQNAYEEIVQKLVLPFEEKGQEIRGKAFEIASKSAIDTPSFQVIADEFFKDNPSQAKALRAGGAKAAAPASLDTSLLVLLDKARWIKPAPGSLSERWLNAVRAQRWQQVAYFIQQAGDKKLLPSEAIGLMKGVAWATAGAQAEALSELDDVRKSLLPGARAHLTLVLADYFSQSFNHSRSESLRKELPQKPL